MAMKKKGALRTIVETVGEVIQTVGAEVGLVTKPEKPKSKSARKAAHKAVIEQSEQARKVAMKAKRVVQRRAET